ncbi:methyl-coenzyme M reductase glutamine C-methyltransferase [Methanothrix soehngenii]|uniref:methyl-coenzyme M reductase glutamine C-methyltransferase n=1 Tax=Methanothrix soehngenii TaxID=2223 RepID=UPI002355155D|nr:methyl-coenzyme M reductase glutamine C-methyltransferase [Methanothrix soehngenii]
MMIDIVSPGTYTYGSLVLGGVLRDRGHDIKITRKLESRGESVLLSLFSTLQLLDPKIRDFVAERGNVCVGGPVSLCPEMVLGELNPKAVVSGEGEDIVAPLVENGPEGLAGVAYRHQGEIIKSPPEPVSSLDHILPLIPDDLGQQNVRGANVYIETHRGCLGSCTFCQVPRFFGRNIRSRSIENIVDEVKEMKRLGVKRVAISGGTGSLFGYRNKINREAFVEMIRSLSQILGKRNLSVPDMRVDLVDETVLEAVRDYTIGWVFFGLESGSDRILRAMRKGVTVEDNLRAVELARSLGVKVGGSFIVGYPGETREDFEETMSFVEEAMLDDVFVSIAEPIPGTSLSSQVLDMPKDVLALYQEHQGEYQALRLSEAEARCFELMLQGESSKPIPRALSQDLYNAYLDESRSQGRDIKRVVELLEKYRDVLPH